MRESSDACLFVKDLDKNNRDYAPSVEHFKDLLESKGVSKVAEVRFIHQWCLMFIDWELISLNLNTLLFTKKYLSCIFVGPPTPI